MAKISNKTKDKIWRSTQICYCKALKEHYPDVFKSWHEPSFKVKGFDSQMREILYDLQLESRNADIHNLYMKHVLKLTTKELELILLAANQGVINRAPHTLDAIVEELLERSINDPETKEKA